MQSFTRAKKIGSAVIIFALFLFSLFCFLVLNHMNKMFYVIIEREMPIYEHLLQVRTKASETKRLFDIYVREPRIQTSDVLAPIQHMIGLLESGLNGLLPSEDTRLLQNIEFLEKISADTSLFLTHHTKKSNTALINNMRAQLSEMYAQSEVSLRLAFMRPELQDNNAVRLLFSLFEKASIVIYQYFDQSVVREKDIYIVLTQIYDGCIFLQAHLGEQNVQDISEVLHVAQQFEAAMREYSMNEQYDPASATTAEMKEIAVYFAEQLHEKISEMVKTLHGEIAALQEEGLQHVHMLGNVLVIGSMGISVIVLVIFIWVGCVTTGRLAMLHNGVAQFSVANLHYRIPVSGNDQFAQLGRAFNEMIKALEMTTVSKEYVDAIFASISDILIVIRPDGIITDVNVATEQLFSSERSELLGKSLLQFMQSEERFWLANVAGENNEMEMSITTKNGTIVWVLCSWSCVDHTTRSIVLVGKDISARKMAEEQKEQHFNECQHAQKMESIGTLAAGIAHELNTPIQFIGDNANFLKQSVSCVLSMIETYKQHLLSENVQRYEEIIEKREADVDYSFLCKETPEALTQIMEGVSRVTTIVNAMKNYAHAENGEPCSADINDAIATTVTITRNEWKYHADLETNLGNIPAVACHIGDIKQVVLNLIVNASHAIKDKFDISRERGKIIITTEQSTDDHVRVSIADTGAGIPKDVRARVFDQFFTTKEVGKGTGQGLSLAYYIIVKKHKGKIWFDTEVDKGTTFFVELPLGSDAL